jgi:hypothetical protein
MARNGAGTYTLPAGNPVTTGTTISSTWANNTLNDIASSLTASIAYDGQTAPVANLPMATYAHTGVGNATVRTMYASAGQVQDNALAYLTSVSGTDTITAIAPVSMNAYTVGQTFRFIAAGANTTTSVTLNINSIGAKAITKNGTTALVANDILAGSVVIVTYDGTEFQLSNPATLPAAVSSFNAGTTGFTPSSATTGAVTLAGTLNVANGGTGATTLTSGSVIVGNGTSAVSLVAPTTTGNVLFTTNGTSWSSTPKITSGTLASPASGTNVDFTGLPSWVKRITVMLNGVTMNSTNSLSIRLGYGATPTYASTGYTSVSSRTINGTGSDVGLNTVEFSVQYPTAGVSLSGSLIISLIGSNNWSASGVFAFGSNCVQVGGGMSLGNTLTAIRVGGGGNTFTAGAINILYE